MTHGRSLFKIQYFNTRLSLREKLLFWNETFTRTLTNILFNYNFFYFTSFRHWFFKKIAFAVDILFDIIIIILLRALHYLITKLLVFFSSYLCHGTKQLRYLSWRLHKTLLCYFCSSALKTWIFISLHLFLTPVIFRMHNAPFCAKSHKSNRKPILYNSRWFLESNSLNEQINSSENFGLLLQLWVMSNEILNYLFLIFNSE